MISYLRYFCGKYRPLPAKVLLLTPPFTQLNTPYPATAYLKGYLNKIGVSSFQADLGIDVTLALFSEAGMNLVFDRIAQVASAGAPLSDNARRILALRNEYLRTIGTAIGFLQGLMPSLAHRICQRNFLPEASRFAQVQDLQWAFGSMGNQDKARHLATLYLEDLSDFIKECLDPFFGFSRYAERMGRSATSFDELDVALKKPFTVIDEFTISQLDQYMRAHQPAVVAVSIPFPGNLYAGFRCAQHIRAHYPGVDVVAGGGFVNTELRELKDKRVFDYFHFLTFDEGYIPIERILQCIEGQIGIESLKRTLVRTGDALVMYNDTACGDAGLLNSGTPDYTDLRLNEYVSAIEVTNPMHSLWSDGRWMKLTMAHGCYWGKCTFCDITLDYIKIYEPVTAQVLCDRIETIMAATGQTGFHFVDEAAPPSLMKALALEILRRGLVISWWTNIRFEKSYTPDLCLLLRASGCIAVSGGLEVASDRLLKLIDKGITVDQVVRVNRHFTEAGIMVHAYLMYGFPTQSAQETIDSLEVVRQMFLNGILQSGYWHLFTMTVHSPVGKAPEKFGVQIDSGLEGDFAHNDLVHQDPKGADHIEFGEGLKKSVYNYMLGACLDHPLAKWFDFKTPRPLVDKDHVSNILNTEELRTTSPEARVVWLGYAVDTEVVTKSKKGNTWEVASLTFQTPAAPINIRVDKAQGLWLASVLPLLAMSQTTPWTLRKVKEHYEAAGLEDFELFWDNKPISGLAKAGLLVV